MPSLKKRIVEKLKGLIPVQVRTIWNPRNEPRSEAAFYDVDRIHDIFEKAQDGDCSELWALYRDMLLTDSHLQGELFKRKGAVLGDPLSILPWDKKDAADVEAAKAIENMISNYGGWLDFCNHLLNSALWPVAVGEKVFIASDDADLNYDLWKLVPVPDQLLDFSTGRLMIFDTDEAGNVKSTKHEPDPDSYIIHRGHLLGTPDNWGGPMRSLAFWWLFSILDRDWLVRFLERYGAPFLVGKYESADEDAKSVLTTAFSAATKLWGIVITKGTEVEIQQAAASMSADAFEKFFTNLCQREKSKLIIGQTLSAEAQSTGLGSGVSKQQEGVRQDIRALDVMRLGQTLREQLFAQYLRINGFTGRPPRASWGAESYENAALMGKLLSDLKTSGFEPTDDALPGLSDKVGFQLQRAAAPAPAGFQLPLAARADLPPSLLKGDQANDAIASKAAADLAQSFRGSLAPVRQIILQSRSPQEAEQGIRALYADWSPQAVNSLVEQALRSYAANGTVAAEASKS